MGDISKDSLLKVLEARIIYLTNHPEEASGEEVFRFIECARNLRIY